MDHYLKKEIEEYRSGDKKINYNSKKDVMIKMLIDELERCFIFKGYRAP